VVSVGESVSCHREALTADLGGAGFRPIMPNKIWSQRPASQLQPNTNMGNIHSNELDGEIYRIVVSVLAKHFPVREIPPQRPNFLFQLKNLKPRISHLMTIKISYGELNSTNLSPALFITSKCAGKTIANHRDHLTSCPGPAQRHCYRGCIEVVSR
jgi:hypothetical protein